MAKSIPTGTPTPASTQVWRRILHITAGISLILCLLLMAVQAGGGFAGGRAFKGLAGRWEYSLSGEYAPEGPLVIQLVLLHAAPTRIVGPVIPMGSSPQWDAWEKQYRLTRWHGHGFGLEYGPQTGTDSARRAVISGTRIHLIVPYWAMELILLVLPVLVWTPRFWRRRIPGPGEVPCPKCGYDLCAMPERCPECGTAVTPSQPI